MQDPYPLLPEASLGECVCVLSCLCHGLAPGSHLFTPSAVGLGREPAGKRLENSQVKISTVQ